MSIARRPAAWLAAGLLGLFACRSHDAHEGSATPAPPAAPAAAKPPAAPAAPADAGEAQSDLPEPSNARPVVVAASLAPARIAAGATSVLTIRVKVAPTWHIYPLGDSGGANAPTELGLDLPAGIAWSGEWSEPPLSRDPMTHAAIHSGEFEFRRTLKADPSAAGSTHELEGWMSFQVCDPMMCRPPARLDWKATLIVLAATGAPIPAPKTTRGADEDGSAGKIDLRVLYIGAGEAATGRAQQKVARSKEMVEFLKSRFASVESADRDHYDCGREAGADVVLLDWSQSELDLDQLAKLRSPIGPRDEWKTPIVLLGSAGLLLGVPWQLKGGFG
jgi:hypothetical protein